MEHKQNHTVYLRTVTIAAVIVCVAVCIAFGLLVPRASRALRHAVETLSSVDELVVTADVALANANKALAAANEAADAANRLVTDNAAAVTEAMEKINALDFESLNNAIRDLESIVEPLAKLANLFR